jgi:hypothetical protein
MKTRSSIIRISCFIAFAVAAAGCGTAVPAGRRAGADFDPCAERLHDTCGRLLLFFSINGRLPDTLDELARVDSQTPPPPGTGAQDGRAYWPGRTGPLVCPVSGKPYVYSKDGPRVPGRAGRLVLYDAEPVHSGMRWGVLADVAAEGRPPTLRVILVPETPVFATEKQKKARQV